MSQIPITNATIKVFSGEKANIGSVPDKEVSLNNDPVGTYKVLNNLAGAYTVAIEATGKGTVVKYITLPDESNVDIEDPQTFRYDIEMIQGRAVVPIQILDKNNANVLAGTGNRVLISYIDGVDTGIGGIWNVPNVPITVDANSFRLFEFIPSATDMGNFQDYKVFINVPESGSLATIYIYPPFQVNVDLRIDGAIKNSSRYRVEVNKPTESQNVWTALTRGGTGPYKLLRGYNGNHKFRVIDNLTEQQVASSDNPLVYDQAINEQINLIISFSEVKG